MAPPSPPVVQRYGWAILDSRAGKDDDPEIVRNNLRLASQHYKNAERIEVTTDPESVEEVEQIRLGDDEPLHIHGHGTTKSVAGFGADSLAREVRRKFDNLQGRTILLHACEAGSGAVFLRAFLTALAGNKFQGWNGTRVLAPERFLVVTEGGLSQVSRGGVKASELKTRESQQGKLLRKGEGWRGVQVVNHSVQDIPAHRIKEIVIRAMKENG